MKFKIRRIKTDDRSSLKVFFRDVITHTFIKEGVGDETEFMEEEIKEKMKYIDTDLKTNGKERFFLVALIDNTIVGTVGYGQAGELIARGSGGKLHNMNEIGSVFVSPSYQQKGIGSLLLNAMYLALMGRGVESFSLDSGYPTAQKVWCKKFGQPTYVMKDQWGEGLDHYIWKIDMDTLAIEYSLDVSHV